MLRIDRRRALVSLGALGVSTVAPTVHAAEAPFSVVDLNVGLPYQVAYRFKKLSHGSGAYRAEQLRAAGVSGVVMQLQFPPGRFPTGQTMSATEKAYRAFHRALQQSPSYAAPGCGESGDKIRTWLSLQTAVPFVKDVDSIGVWVERGVRLFGLVNRYDSAIASSSGKRPQSSWGFRSRGRDVVSRIWAERALVDVSHCSDAATAELVDMAKTAKMPLVASHSDVRALSPHKRNLTDEQLRAIADSGGVVGLTFHRTFLAAGRYARIDHAVQHARHMVKVMGIEHVGIGSDLESGLRPPKELSDVSGFPRLATALLASGFSRGDVQKIFSKNALRVLCSS